MKIRFMWCFCAISLLLLLGCAGSHFGVQDKSVTVPDQFIETEAAIASAEKSAGAKYCPDKIAKAKDLARKGVETYWACRTAEGMAMLADARKLAKEAEGCQPPPSPAAPAPRVAPPAPQPPPPPKVISLNWVYFDTDKADLKPQAIATLDENVRVLKENPNLTIELAGHTDATGSDSYNKMLSQKRVQKVQQYLTSKGIPASRLRTVAFGKEKPVAENKTKEGRAKNRRVEIRVIQ
jgi:outer membrane protein OmpA-like peptidoglycan-associated protein